jgi:hypothetical protein
MFVVMKIFSFMATRNKSLLTKFLSTELQLNREERTVGFSFTSKSNICERYSYSDELPDGASVVFDEYLSHDPEAWDLSRVNNNACPFLKNHTRGQKIGIIKSVALDGEKGVCISKLSKNALADQFMSDIEDGTSGGISFGYIVEEYKVISPAEYSTDREGYRKLTKKALLEATKIVLFEISSEDIPADPTVGYGKSLVELDNVTIDGNPNFYPQLQEKIMNQPDTKSLELELASAKSALSEANDANASLKSKQEVLIGEINNLQAKQQILTSENGKLAEQVKQFEWLLEQKAEIISNFEKKELVASRYYDLRQKAEDLVSQAKLSGSEFNELFSTVPSEDIGIHTKSQTDKLSYIDFHLSLIEKRAKPLINLEQSVKDPVVNPGQVDSKQIESHAAELLKTVNQSPIFM